MLLLIHKYNWEFASGSNGSDLQENSNFDFDSSSKNQSSFGLVGNRDGRTQSARVGCRCTWLSGPGFQDLDKRTLPSSAAAVFLHSEVQ